MKHLEQYLTSRKDTINVNDNTPGIQTHESSTILFHVPIVEMEALGSQINLPKVTEMVNHKSGISSKHTGLQSQWPCLYASLLYWDS